MWGWASDNSGIFYKGAIATNKLDLLNQVLDILQLYLGFILIHVPRLPK